MYFKNLVNRNNYTESQTDDVTDMDICVFFKIVLFTNYIFSEQFFFVSL
jgi:hypothetical protein